MTLIRSQSVAGQASTLAHARAERAHREAEAAAERLRAAGRTEAERAAAERIAAAERRAVDAERNADERVARATTALEARLGGAAAALERALANLGVLEGQLTAAAEAEVVRLALAVASRVLAREVESDQAWMRGVLTTALAELPDRRRVVVRCAPADAAAIRARLAATAAAVPGSDNLTLEDDPSLAPGSLVLVAGGTRLDASAAASWERVAAALLARVPTPPLTMRDDGTVPEDAP